MQKSRLIPTIALAVSVAVATSTASSPLLAKDKPQGGAAEVHLLNDPESTELLNQLGRPLIEAAGLAPQRPVQFHIILARAINAFALPNHHIVFHSGLIESARDPGELSGVLAHELGHLAAGHAIQLQEAAGNISVRTLITMAAGIAAGVAAKDGQIIGATLMGSSAAGQSTLLDTMRQKEHQADQLAVHYLSRAHIGSDGMIHFMERLNREQRLAVLPAPYLLTHPLNSQRVIELRDMAQQQRPTTDHEASGSQQQNQQWLARVQAKLEAIQATDPQQLALQLEQKLPAITDDKSLFVARYALALALRYAGELERAEQLFSRLLQQQPQDVWLLRERALTRLERGQLSPAETDLRSALQQRPEQSDLRYHLARALNERKQYPAASGILRQLTIDDQEDARAFYLLGQVEQQLGHIGSSHLALARYARLTMDLDASLWHYREAEKTLPSASLERDTLPSELAQIRKLRQERRY
ncbi:MAG: M48 family metalloprotease [Magnetococcales bacterium]|nr:M48 family metalloprotease [Magnetococcales bacterium]